ncbi:MAG: LamG-like jellyroll fold domain-containing protein [Acidobacteriota bacterium]
MHLPDHLKWFIRLTAILLLTGSASATTPVARWALDDGAGTTVRDSIGGHDGTAFGPAWVEGRVGGALRFDGLNDYVSVPAAFSSDTFTITGWLETGTSGTVYSAAPAAYSVYLTPDGSQLRFRVDTRNAGGTVSWIGAPLPSSGWHAFAASFDGHALRLYLDGVLEATRPVSVGVVNNPASGFIGTFMPGLSPFAGSLDDVRVYDVALSDEEILGLAGSENAPPMVNAGPDFETTTGSVDQLTAVVSDDGLPDPPAALSTLWSMVSGPALPFFANSETPTTNVTFSAPGTYVLRLTANDSSLSVFDEVTATVTSSVPSSSLGQVQAEDFKEGGEGVGYHDTTVADYGGTNYRPGESVDIYADGDGYFVGHFRAGEWLAYDVDVPSTRSYDIRLRLMGTVAITRQLSIQVDGAETTGPFDVSVPDSMVWFDFTYGGLPLTQGRHEIRIQAETNSLNLDYFELLTVGGNLPPVVDAGPDLAVVLPASASLQGHVTDDGHAYPTPELTWSTASGPGRVTFSSPHTASTLATFNVNGVYVLTLTAFDGEEFGSDSVTVSVSDSTVNQPPVAYDQSVSVTRDIPKQIVLDFDDSGGPAPYTFTYGSPGHGQLEGTGATVTFTPDRGYTGPDSFIWSVSDGQYQASATVTISVNPPLQQGAIVIDHTDLSAFDRIPADVLAAARNLRVLFADRSVGVNLDQSLDCLAAASWDSAPDLCKRDYASIDAARSRYTLGGSLADEPLLAYPIDPVTYGRSNWTFESFYDVWYETVKDYLASFAPARLPEYDIVTFQFSYLNNDPSIADPACGFLATGDRQSCPDYLQGADVGGIAALEAANPDKHFVYWTTSLSRNSDPVLTEFNAQMRQYALNNGKVLFDFADIESHDPDGSPCYDAADGVPYYLDGTLEENFPSDGVDNPAICRRYTTETTGGHLGSVSGGRVQVAKGFWLLMSCIAGWEDPACGP